MRTRSSSRSTIITAGTIIIAATTVRTGIISCRTWSCRGITITAATTITTRGGIITTAKHHAMTNGPDILRPVFFWADVRRQRRRVS